MLFHMSAKRDNYIRIDSILADGIKEEDPIQIQVLALD